MKRFAIVGIVLLLIAIFASLIFVGWNIYSLRQMQASIAPDAAYGRGMMRGYTEPNTTQGVTTDAPFGRGGMMGRGMMGSIFSSTPSTNAVPTVAPDTGKSSSATSSSASSIASSASSATPGILSKSGNGYSGKAGNLNIVLTMNPTPAAFSTTTFDITLTDEKGTAVSDAKITLDLTMPSMFMPSNKPQAQSLGDGKYQATGRFTMRGGWRINVIIERGGQKQNAYVDIGL